MDPEKMLTYPVDSIQTDAQLTVEAEGICGGPLGQDPEIKIRWTVDKERMKKQRIDLSVHKNGMAQGRYTTMFPSNEKAGFRPAKLTDPKQGGRVEVLPSLERLKVQRLEPMRTGPANKTGGGGERMELTLVNFEPGLNYFIRVLTLENEQWVAGSVVRVEAPVCPVDEFMEER